MAVNTNSLTPELAKALQNAYEAGLEAISGDSQTMHVPAESFEAVTKVEKHRWHWRPDQPKLILVAESHVYTSDAALRVTINQNEVAPLLAKGEPLPPCEYVGLVYCLGYGETKLLRNRHDEFSIRGTWQYWDLFGRLAATGKQPRASARTTLRERLKWKLGTLMRLKELGVWLLDGSVHAIYLGGRLRRSPETCQALHRQWCQNYGNRVIEQAGNPVVWVIGAGARGCLSGSLRGFERENFIYQPNARDVDLNLNWDRLMAYLAHVQNAART
jgi:hypothetical protein